jgi:Sulfotransferase family
MPPSTASAITRYKSINKHTIHHPYKAHLRYNGATEQKKRMRELASLSFGLVIMFAGAMVGLNLHHLLRLEHSVATAHQSAALDMQALEEEMDRIDPLNDLAAIGAGALVSVPESESVPKDDEETENVPAEESVPESDVPAIVEPPTQMYLKIPIRPKKLPKNLVKPGDYIYYKSTTLPKWDAAPIVIENYKLVFFTIPKVGCTVWKQLFRRMMGFEDWLVQNEVTHVPHNPQYNGLKYLSDYPLEKANEIMTSPEWTRAIMVRDPKRRLLSSFLDKAMSNDHRHIIHRCCPNKGCVKNALTIPGFLELIGRCDDEHWRSQHKRIESKYWPYIDFVGHVETASSDAKMLLTKLGAWDEYGATGWGVNGTQSIFGNKDIQGRGEHATWSQFKHWEWFTPEIEQMVENYYREDYLNPLFEFKTGRCLTCS